MQGASPHLEPARWELYRLLSEPLRLRLLALTADEELAIGELAELLREGQPNVSRHVGALRKAGLLLLRKQGTRSFVRAREGLAADAVLADALGAGRGLCEADGSLGRIAAVVAARDAGAREYFAREHDSAQAVEALPTELPAYLSAIGALLGRFRLSVDVGTGDGSLLDAIAPLSERVIAVDRERVQLARARQRASARGYRNVELVCDDYDGEKLVRTVRDRGGADVVFAARVLHHAPKPAAALKALTGLLAPGGRVVVIDYAPHEDEAFRERQADLWLGFAAEELREMARAAGLADARVVAIDESRAGAGPDETLQWQALIARCADPSEGSVGAS